MTYVVPWWSPSKFVCYEQCPAEFYRRYVLHEPIEPNTPMYFGTAVHKGLEAHFRGQDGDLAFRRTWRSLIPELQAAQRVVPSALFETGLELIERVRSLNISGEPERRIWQRTDLYLGAPLLGYVDLWCEDTDTIVDFKTTLGAWSQERAEREIWQPCLYSMVYWLERGTIPTFEYIVLNRSTAELQRFITHRTEQQIADMLGRARQISLAVQRQEWACTCREHQDTAA
jgi:hypothetical protein